MNIYLSFSKVLEISKKGIIEERKAVEAVISLKPPSDSSQESILAYKLF